MMQYRTLKHLLGLGALSLLLAGCTSNNSMNGMDHTKMDHSKMPGMDAAKSGDSSAPPAKAAQSAIQTLDGKNATLIAEASTLDLNGNKLQTWSYNGSIPGPQLRVKQGETVKVTLKNNLNVPTSIHWHGYPVPFEQDGIPGMTQNAVQPGQSYTYEFKATVPGTYWYHSHQDSVNQVDRGLYGTLVVEGNEEKVDRDYTLVLDEWMSHGMDMGSMSMGNMNMGGMNHGSGSMDSMNHGTAASSSTGHDMSMYDLYTMNGKTGSAIEPLKVKQGDNVRIRIVNAGYLTHTLHLHGHDYRIVSTDGNPLKAPVSIKDQMLAVAPGERYDIEFTANNPGKWYLEEHGDKAAVTNMKAVIEYEGQSQASDQPGETVKLPVVSLDQYGQSDKGQFSLDQKYALEYTMKLGTSTDTKGQQVFTINDKVFPNTEAVQVKKGDTIKVRFMNTSQTDDHPMHLHGHTFQVLSKNGLPLTGAPIYKDTLNVKPGEEYVVAFEANNPGEWMFHCHDLHHASAGMVTELKYTDFNSTFVADPNSKNNPE